MALFAALSYAVTQSGRGGGNVDRETAALAASQLVQYGALANSVITRMQIAGGCSDTDFSFERSPFDGTDAAYVNPTSPSDFSCHFYHPNGGAMTEFDPNSVTGLTEATSEAEFYGSARISGVGTDLNGPPLNLATDLAMYVRNIDPSTCDALNDGIGLPQTFTDSGDLNVAPFIGSYNVQDGLDGCVGIVAGDFCNDDPSISPIGSRRVINACFIENDTGDRIYFHAVLAR